MLSKAYDPKACEDRMYKLWEESGAFKADHRSSKEPFTISMPPPNATGELHIGNALMLALEDIFIRFARMRGKEALWVPGMDHAAIATESIVIKKLQRHTKMKDPRAQLGREALLSEIRTFVEDSKHTIRGQIRKMGSSCDWSRERYTMEPTLNRCVNEVFAKMYRDGLIYRGHRIVNWDPKLQTTVSDDEIEYEERTEPFYTFQYGSFQVSTSRPETKFGDKYVVMHPDDARYSAYTHGQKISLEWINGPITATIIKDKAVDPTFGTGVMTITPWHDHVDFEIAERHDLDKEQIIGFDGKLLPIAGEFSGMHIEDARLRIVEKIKAKSLLVGVDNNYVHNVALSQRGGGLIEPQIKEQWFIDVNARVVWWKRRELSLKEVMQEVVKEGLITITPNRFEKVYFHWIDNLRDWCISRQIWWGHRIPVWYRISEGSMDIHVGVQGPKGAGWTQDPDTLDTWFSSALWTWSTLIDRDLALDHSITFEDLLLQSPDFQKFHPTDVMETGYDILFFWVARMILMTTYVTGSVPQLEYGQVPFDTVYLHGLIRDREGRKMSKSHPETNIDPLDMIKRYGADALRLSMIVGQSPGNDFRLYEEKISGYRNFVNKLWNASRFVLLQCEQAGVDPQSIPNLQELSLADRALLSALQKLIKDVTKGLEEYRLSDVGERLYSFLWDFFCDWYLELSKGRPNLPLLVHAVRTFLILLHPYIPFVTEELWSSFKPKGSGMLIREQWVTSEEKWVDTDAETQFAVLTEVVKAVRKLRADYNVNPRAMVHVCVVSAKQADFLEEQRSHIARLGKVETLEIELKKPKFQNVASAILPSCEVYLLLEGLIDVAGERERLAREKEHSEQYLRAIEKKLENKEFLARAPEGVVYLEREKHAEVTDKLRKISERLEALPRST